MATRMSARLPRLAVTWQVCSVGGSTQLPRWQNTVTARANRATALQSKLVRAITSPAVFIFILSQCKHLGPDVWCRADTVSYWSPHQHPVRLQTSPLRSTVRPSPWLCPGLKVQGLTPTPQQCRTVMVRPQPARAQRRVPAAWWALLAVRSTIPLWSLPMDTVKAHPLLRLTRLQVGHIVRW